MEKNDTSAEHLLAMLIEAIDYAYLKTDGKYGPLSVIVADKVRYIKKVHNAGGGTISDFQKLITIEEE